ncbi:MAG: dTDP-4-dehydrorhamnose 3,5-epimerase family protein [Polyangiaceae bacterium]
METVKVGVIGGSGLYAMDGLSDVVEVQYKCSNYYDGKTEAGIAYDDPDIAIPWPVDTPIVSERDRNNPSLRDVFPEAGS